MSGASAGLPHPYFRPERPGAVPLISPGELLRQLEGPDPPLLIDVRPASERALAHLPGDRSLPFSELPTRLAELSRARPIVLYCQFGNRSRRAVEFLERQGYDRAAALEGGIDEYARLVDPRIPRYREPPGAAVVLEQWPRADSGCLTYFLGDPSERLAVILDPGREIEPYLAELHRGGWTLEAIVESHTHADHLAGHAALAERTGAPIYVSQRSPASYPHRRLSDGEAVEFGNLELLAWETPGHTRDHLTLRLGDRAFTGDTLLLGSCGRTDLGDGSPEMLWESLQRLVALPPETEVFPAHFGRRHALVERYASTIGFERGTNEALTQGSREAFLRYMTEGWPPKPVDFDRIVLENLES
jgi:sulfur dioxygenase